MLYNNNLFSNLFIRNKVMYKLNTIDLKIKLKKINNKQTTVRHYTIKYVKKADILVVEFSLNYETICEL